jgi:hypothetical protein
MSITNGSNPARFGPTQQAMACVPLPQTEGTKRTAWQVDSTETPPALNQLPASVPPPVGQSMASTTALPTARPKPDTCAPCQCCYDVLDCLTCDLVTTCSRLSDTLADVLCPVTCPAPEPEPDAEAGCGRQLLHCGSALLVSSLCVTGPIGLTIGCGLVTTNCCVQSCCAGTEQEREVYRDSIMDKLTACCLGICAICTGD